MTHEKTEDNPNGAGRIGHYSPSMLMDARHYADNYKEEGDVVPSVAGQALVKLARLVRLERTTCGLC